MNMYSTGPCLESGLDSLDFWVCFIISASHCANPKIFLSKTIVILEWCGYVQVLWHRKTRSTSEKLLVEPWNNLICSSARKIACSTQWRSGFARHNGADWRLSIQSYLCVHWWKDWPKDRGLGIYSCFSIINLSNGALCTVPLSQHWVMCVLQCQLWIHFPSVWPAVVCLPLFDFWMDHVASCNTWNRNLETF